MNLASNCRHPLWFPLLCRKWVWLSWSLSSLEWKSTASITAMSHSLSRCCQRSNMLQAIRLSFNKNNSHLKKQRLTPWKNWFRQSTCVADSRMLCSLLLCGAPSRSFWQWRVVQLRPGDILNYVSCFLVRKHAAFKWKDAISGIFPGSAEAILR